MSAEVFTGFTPVPDCIRAKHGPIVANVFGAVWRFGQQQRGACEASIENIAKRAGYGTTATRAALRILAADGWIGEEPRKGKPTIYRDAGRWVLSVAGQDTAEVHPTPTRGVAPNPPPQRVALPTPTRGVALTPTRGVAKDSTVLEDTFKTHDSPRRTRSATAKASAADKPPRQRDELFDAFCRAWAIDPDKPGNKAGLAGAFASRCRADGATVDELRDYYREKTTSGEWGRYVKPHTLTDEFLAWRRTTGRRGEPSGALREVDIRARWPHLTFVRDGRLAVKSLHALAAEGVIERDSYDYLDRSTWPADVVECAAAVDRLHAGAGALR